MRYKVIRVIEKTDVLAENLQWEDAIAIMNDRAKNQLSRKYRYEVRNEAGSLINSQLAFGEGS